MTVFAICVHENQFQILVAHRGLLVHTAFQFMACINHNFAKPWLSVVLATSVVSLSVKGRIALTVLRIPRTT